MSLINFVVIAISAWISWQRCRRAYDELMALDDRLLADIGLRRTDIPQIFHEKVRRRVERQGVAIALSELLAKPVLGHHHRLPPIWPQP